MNLASLAVTALSCFGIGGICFSAVLDGLMAKSLHDVRVFRALAKLGSAVITGTILWSIILPNMDIIQVTPAYYPYIVGLALMGVGGLGTAFKMIHVYVEFEQEDE